MRQGRPNVTSLAGYYQELAEEGEYAEIERARRIEHADGRIDIVVHDTERDYPWEARLTADPGSRVFRGQMWSTEWDGRYDLEADLWLSPDDDEILLLGTFTSDDDEPVDFKIVLFEEDDEDDDEDEDDEGDIDLDEEN